MFTQIGLNNLWNDAKSVQGFSFDADFQIICDSFNERCMRIFSQTERKFVYFSSRRLLNAPEQPYSVWVRSLRWEPETLSHPLNDEALCLAE